MIFLSSINRITIKQQIIFSAFQRKIRHMLLLVGRGGFFLCETKKTLQNQTTPIHCFSPPCPFIS
jgi:hypothetical protein